MRFLCHDLAPDILENQSRALKSRITA